MKYFFILIAAILLTSCHKQVVNKTEPAPPIAASCIDSRIADFKTKACPEGASVKQYTFQSKTVFAFNRGACGADLTTEILDADCKRIGMLGGITGNKKINGEDFSSAQLVKTIWQD